MKEINPADYVLVRDRDSMLYLAKQRSFYGINWENQLYKLSERKGFRPNIRDFVDLVLLLESNKSIYDGNGKKISVLEKKEILDDIKELKEPWRGEYFDNRFFDYLGNMFMGTGHRIISGKIRPSIIKIVNLIEKDGYIRFSDLDEDGLAKKVGEGNIFCCYPRDGTVARFVADSVWANLDCSRIPTGSIADLGVREAREKI